MYNKIIPKKIIVHCSDGSINQKFEDIERWHRDARDINGNFRYHYGKPSSLGYYCAYNYVIDWEGNVTQARGDDERGAHTVGENDKSVGVCMIGRFDIYGPSKAQIEALTGILRPLMRKFNISAYDIYPHRKYNPLKSCYGSFMSDTWASDLVNEDPVLIKQLWQQIEVLREKLARLTGKRVGAIDDCCV